MKTLKLFAPLLLMMCLLVSCQKTGMEKLGPILLPTSISWHSEDTYLAPHNLDIELRFLYDDQNRIVEVQKEIHPVGNNILYQDPPSVRISKIFYAEDAITINSSTYDIEGHIKPFSTSSTILIVSGDLVFADDDYQTSFVIDKHGRAIKHTYTYFVDGNMIDANVTMTKNYQYDRQGNMIKSDNTMEIEWRPDSSITTETFGYDNHNGLFKNVKSPQWFILYLMRWHYFEYNIKHNWIEENVTRQKCEIQYNAEKYPTFISHIIKSGMSGGGWNVIADYTITYKTVQT